MGFAYSPAPSPLRLKDQAKFDAMRKISEDFEVHGGASAFTPLSARTGLFLIFERIFFKKLSRLALESCHLLKNRVVNGV